jgi:hypothetical protein
MVAFPIWFVAVTYGAVGDNGFQSNYLQLFSQKHTLLSRDEVHRDLISPGFRWTTS